MQKQKKSLPVEKLISFPSETKISTLSINKLETKLLGMMGKRIFVFNLLNKSLNFLTSDLELVQNPTWHPDGNTIYYSSVENKIHNIYRYSLENNTKFPLIKGYAALRHYDDKGFIAINRKLEAWVLSLNNNNKIEAAKLLGQVGSANPNKWHVSNDFLYFTRRSGVNAFMTRVDITTSDQKEKFLAKNLLMNR